MTTAEQLLIPADYETKLQVELTPGEQAICDVLEVAVGLDDPDSNTYKAYYDTAHGIKPTPVWQVPDKLHGHTVYIKDETSHALTIDGTTYDSSAFKRRGAWLAASLALDRNPAIESFVTASAGNHALGVALAAKALGKSAHIYCKSDISGVKRQKLEALGATIHAYYSNLEDALEAAEFKTLEDDEATATSLFIHPFDQNEVIAGQAGSAFEWLASMEAAQRDGEIDLMNDDIQVVVPIGGGGLISAWASVLQYAKATGRIGDNVRLAGAQMERCDAMNRALRKLDAGEEPADLFAPREHNDHSDGTAVYTPGKMTLAITREYVDEIILVTPGEVGIAMAEQSEILLVAVEPAGALAAAASNILATRKPNLNGDRRSYITMITSGANVSQPTQKYFSRMVEIEAGIRAFEKISAEAVAAANAEAAERYKLLDLEHQERERVAKARIPGVIDRKFGSACLNGATVRDYVHVSSTAHR